MSYPVHPQTTTRNTGDNRTAKVILFPFTSKIIALDIHHFLIKKRKQQSHSSKKTMKYDPTNPHKHPQGDQAPTQTHHSPHNKDQAPYHYQNAYNNRSS